MAHITIKDLPRSDALDRVAMQAVAGGTRNGARPLGNAAVRSGRIVDYPPGFGRSLAQTPTDAKR